MITAMVTRIGNRRRAHLYIKEWMDERGISDERGASRIGVSRETVWKWRTQQHRLTPDKIASLASLLDLEPEELYRPPGRPSLDAMVKGAPDHIQDMVVDVVRRMIGKA